MTCKDLESKIIDAIDAALQAVEGLPEYQIFGAWQASLANVMKNAETASAVATIYVGVGTKQRITYTAPDATFSGAVALTVRLERDITGETLAAIAAPIEALFANWQGEMYQASYTALDTDDFDVGDIAIQGGGAPTISREQQTITVTWPFTIKGVEKQTTT